MEINSNYKRQQIRIPYLKQTRGYHEETRPVSNKVDKWNMEYVMF